MSSSDFSNYLYELEIAFKEREAIFLKVMHRLRQLGVTHDVTLVPEKMQWPTVKSKSGPKQGASVATASKDKPDSSSVMNIRGASEQLQDAGLVEPNLDDYALSDYTRQLIRMQEQGMDLVAIMESSVKQITPCHPAPLTGPRSAKLASRLPVSVTKRSGLLTGPSSSKTPAFEIQASYSSPMLTLSQKYSEDWGDSDSSRTPKRVLIKNQSKKAMGLAMPRRQLSDKENRPFVNIKSPMVPQIKFTGVNSLNDFSNTVSQKASPVEPILSIQIPETQKVNHIYELECPESPELSEATRMMLLNDD